MNIIFLLTEHDNELMWHLRLNGSWNSSKIFQTTALSEYFIRQIFDNNHLTVYLHCRICWVLLHPALYVTRGNDIEMGCSWSKYHVTIHDTDRRCMSGRWGASGSAMTRENSFKLSNVWTEFILANNTITLLVKHISLFYVFWIVYISNYLLGLWNPEVQCRIQKGPPIIPILSRINSIPRIDTYFFKIHSNIVLSSTPVYSGN
jgi:hypothetical protein